MNKLKLINDPQFSEKEFSLLFSQKEYINRKNLIAALNKLQNQFGFLSRNSMEFLGEKMKLSLNEICAVASFYSSFRFEPGGKYIIEICIGTACHVKGAGRIYDAFYKLLNLNENKLCSADGLFSLKETACLGCCMMAPAVRIENSLYGPVKESDCSEIIETFLKSRNTKQKQNEKTGGSTEFLLCDCSSCRAAGAGEIRDQLLHSLRNGIWDAGIKRTACSGNSEAAPMLCVEQKDGSVHSFFRVKPEDLAGIIRTYAPVRKLRGHFSGLFNRFEESFLGKQKHLSENRSGSSRDIRLATEGAGFLDPLNLEEYQQEGGFQALEWAGKHNSNEILDLLINSGLRGRGGGGYKTAEKWKAVFKHADRQPYIICNADEGDPGAFMDRMLLESFPFRISEGMMIAALTLQARKAIFYVRCEYPLAIIRLNEALTLLKENNFIGKNAKIPGLQIDIDIVEGAGAFVCGEETALLNSLEGLRGNPRPRPPYPSESGLMGHPTLVNNVETFSIIPWLCRKGAESFSALGTNNNSGTKTFALAGKIKQGGLIEVPLGTRISTIIYEYGGGLPEGSQLKAVQIGGPSGGCLPASMVDMPVDYEALKVTGAMMGSGGLVILDQFDCIVDLARYFMDFSRKESCGRCLWCRSGTESMYRILDRICRGDGKEKDLSELKKISRLCQEFSQCGLGQSAPQPVMTSLKYFPEEYQSHLDGHCPAGVCKEIISYSIDGDCIGCGRCQDVCNDNAITGELWEFHKIDINSCTKCGNCFKVCPEGAINVR